MEIFSEIYIPNQQLLEANRPWQPSNDQETSVKFYLQPQLLHQILTKSFRSSFKGKWMETKIEKILDINSDRNYNDT